VKKAGSIGELVKTSVNASLGGSDIEGEFFIPDHTCPKTDFDK